MADARWVADGAVPPVGTPLLGGAVASPVMALRESAVLANIATMAAYCRDHGVELAPHGKTTMSPQLLALQLEHGAWGVTAATGEHLRTYRRLGIGRIFLANELVDPATIDVVGRELAADDPPRLLCYVDSTEGVRLLDEGLQAAGRAGATLDVLLELGVPGGRTGCRSVEQALAVGRAVAGSARLRLVGVAGYEGVVASGRSPESLAAVASYCARLLELTERLAREDLLGGDGAPLVSAGGSAYFDVVVDVLAGRTVAGRPITVLLRSGAYVSHDHGLYHRVSPFEQPASRYRLTPALRVWGRVLSTPEPGLAIVDFGRRDVPFDQDLPVPLERRSADGTRPVGAETLVVTGLNDQHAFVDTSAGPDLRPGDWLGCGISHPCTAFDKWRSMPVVDDLDVVVGGIDTLF